MKDIWNIIKNLQTAIKSKLFNSQPTNFTFVFFFFSQSHVPLALVWQG